MFSVILVAVRVLVALVPYGAFTQRRKCTDIPTSDASDASDAGEDGFEPVSVFASPPFTPGKLRSKSKRKREV